MERHGNIRCYKCGYVMPLHQSATHQCYLTAQTGLTLLAGNAVERDIVSMVPLRRDELSPGLAPAIQAGHFSKYSKPPEDARVPPIPPQPVLSSILQSNFTQHLKSAQERKRDFKCDQCEYAASSKCNLTHHVRSVHRKERQFRCDQCDYAASVKCNLTLHVQSVHGKKKPFKCHLCDYAASVECT